MSRYIIFRQISILQSVGPLANIASRTAQFMELEVAFSTPLSTSEHPYRQGLPSMTETRHVKSITLDDQTLEIIIQNHPGSGISICASSDFVASALYSDGRFLPIALCLSPVALSYNMSEQSRNRKRDKMKRLFGGSKSSSQQSTGASSFGPSVLPVPTSSTPTELAPIVTLSTAAPSSLAHQSSNTSPPQSTSAQTAESLWDRAIQKLNAADKETVSKLELMQTEQLPIEIRMDKIIGLVKEKQEDCEKKSYKFRVCGRDLILRDVAGKVIVWLNKFKEVGDIAVNFDPIHAALPWAAVRFLLQAVIGEAEQMGALLVIVEKITYLIDRCTLYEVLYGSEDTTTKALHNLHAALIELYSAMLQSMAMAYRLFDKSTASRAVHAQINPNGISDLVTQFENLETRVDREARNCESIRCQSANTKIVDLLDSLQKPIFRIDGRVKSLLEKVDSMERREILDWISDVRYGKHHATIKDERTAHTGEWLVANSRYLEWQGISTSTILWLHGRPGSGKTYLTSRIIDDIESALRTSQNNEGFAYFYCNRNEAQRRDPLAVLRSFVRQLSTTINEEHSMQTQLKQFCFQNQMKGCELSKGECKELLLNFINIYPKTTLVLDALDECETKERDFLIEVFDQFVEKSTKLVKIFVSSRPESDIRARFQSKTNIEITTQDNYDDISRFVESEIVKHPRWNCLDSRFRKEIVETLRKRSDGMFQWAYLQISQLLALRQEEQIRDRLGKLPEGLKVAYDEIFDRMNEHERKIASRACQWVMCAKHPLPTAVLLPAVCQDENDDKVHSENDLDEDLLLEYCHHLLVIDTSRNVWIPSHLSVIEYIETHRWTHLQANCLVSSVCLLRLLHSYENADESISRDLGSYERARNFTEYAYAYWMIHVRKCEDGQDSDHKDRLSTLLQEFLGSITASSLAYQYWLRVCVQRNTRFDIHSGIYGTIYAYNLEPNHSASFAICAFGLHRVLHDWWQSPWPGYANKTKKQNSLLQLAVIANASSICKTLIGWGLDVNEPLGEDGSALAIAASCGNKEIVELLIKSGAEVNMQLQAGRYGSALAAAAWSGNKEMAELLIKSGAEVNMQLQAGEYEMAELLIKSGAEVNMQLQAGEYGSALAAAAAWGGNKEMAELLIKSGAEVNMQLQAGDYGSALAAAVIAGVTETEWDGNKELVEVLLQSGAEVNMQLQTGRYGSALAAAVVAVARRGNKGVVELLIQSGAEVNMQLQAGDYGSALAAAVEEGVDKEVMELLIHSGGDANIQLQSGL
ncbi:hypothetical protein BP5796_12386 [Coleophoma crateriformis]|uniref:Uncharacterized protein n=1 Tax=Coleophoma crateriformis TaxID=565419 RepID=A0A3D8Q9F7_9HELO|nr:hypothetical protein BP5796_12386 [Coleophoma crateriformis]